MFSSRTLQKTVGDNSRFNWKANRKKSSSWRSLWRNKKNNSKTIFLMRKKWSNPLNRYGTDNNFHLRKDNSSSASIQSFNPKFSRWKKITKAYWMKGHSWRKKYSSRISKDKIWWPRYKQWWATLKQILDYGSLSFVVFKFYVNISKLTWSRADLVEKWLCLYKNLWRSRVAVSSYICYQAIRGWILSNHSHYEWGTHPWLLSKQEFFFSRLRVWKDPYLTFW